MDKIHCLSVNDEFYPYNLELLLHFYFMLYNLKAISTYCLKNIPEALIVVVRIE